MEELTQYVLEHMPEIYKKLKYFRLPILVEGRLVWFKYNRGEVDITEKAPAKFKPVVVYNREGKEPQEEKPKREPKAKKQPKSKKDLDEDDFDTMSMLQEDEEDEEDPRTKRMRERKENKFEDEDEDDIEDEPVKGGGGGIVFVILLLLALVGVAVWLFLLGGMNKLKGNKQPVEQPAIQQDYNTDNTIQTTLDLTADTTETEQTEDYGFVDDGTTVVDNEPVFEDNSMQSLVDDTVSDTSSDVGSVYAGYLEDSAEADWSEDFNYNIGDYYSDETGKYFIASEVVNITVPEDRVGQTLKVNIHLRDSISNNADEVFQNAKYEIRELNNSAVAMTYVNNEYSTEYKVDKAGKYSFAILGEIPIDAEVETEEDWSNFKAIITK